MCLRWTAAGMLEAETRFRKVKGYRGLAQLAIHIETHLIKRRHQLQSELTRSMCNHQLQDRPPTDFHDGRGNLGGLPLGRERNMPAAQSTAASASKCKSSI